MRRTRIPAVWLALTLAAGCGDDEKKAADTTSATDATSATDTGATSATDTGATSATDTGATSATDTGATVATDTGATVETDTTVETDATVETDTTVETDVATDDGDVADDIAVVPVDPPCDVLATGLYAWYDAGDAAIVVDGSQRVTSWPARLGTAPALTPVVLGPTLAATGGHPVVRLSGEGGLAAASAAFHTQAHTVIVMTKPSETGENDIFSTTFYNAGSEPATPGDLLLMFLGGGYQPYYAPTDAQFVVMGSAIPATESAVQTVATTYDGAQALPYLDGTAGTGATIASVATGAAPPIVLGGRCTETNCYASGAYQGDVMHLVLFERALSAAEVASMHAWLMDGAEGVEACDD